LQTSQRRPNPVTLLLTFLRVTNLVLVAFVVCAEGSLLFALRALCCLR